MLYELIDYETLKVIWWLLLGVMLIAYAVTDGFDLGAGALLPFVGKTDEERRLIILRKESYSYCFKLNKVFGLINHRRRPPG